MDEASAQPTFSNRIATPWSFPARILWLAATIIALGLFIAGLPLRTQEIQNLYQGSIQAGLIQNENGQVVLSPGSGSPAARAGVLHDDILMAVDDVEITSVEQADADLLDVLKYLAAMAVSAPILFIATYRSEEMHSHSAFIDALPELKRNQRVDTIHLTPLNQDDIARLVTAYHGSCSAELAAYLAERAEGHPLFTVEWGLYNGFSETTAREFLIKMPNAIINHSLASCGDYEKRKEVSPNSPATTYPTKKESNPFASQ